MQVTGFSRSDRVDGVRRSCCTLLLHLVGRAGLANVADNLWTSFIANDPEQIILYCSSPDGNNWGSDYQLSSLNNGDTQSSPLGPSLAVFNNQLYIAFTSATAGDPEVLFCTTADGATWTDQASIGQTSRFAPSLAVGDNRLWAGFVGNDEANENPVLLCSSSDGVNWTGNSFINQFSQTAVAMATFGNQFYVAGISTDGDNAVLVSSVAFGQPWTGPKSIGHFSRFAPSLAVFDNQLYAAFVGLDNQLYVASTADGVNWTPDHTPVHQTSQSAPSLAVFHDQLYVMFIGTDADKPVLVCSTADGAAWTNYTLVNQSSLAAPSLATAPFAASPAASL